MKNKYKLKINGSPKLSKWLTLHNAIAVSYYAFNVLNTIDKCLKDGVIPLPDEIENEALTEYDQEGE